MKLPIGNIFAGSTQPVKVLGKRHSFNLNNMLSLSHVSRPVLSRFFSSSYDPFKVSLSPKPYELGKSKRIGAIAIKKGMMSYFDPYTGKRIPATVLYLDNVRTLWSHPTENAELFRIDVGSKDRDSPRKANISQRNCYKKCNVVVKQHMSGFLVSPDAVLPPNTLITAQHFVPGQYIDVKGISIGKGFQGAMKRWGFKGMPASHGVSLSHRAIGSTGSRQDPGKVFKGKKMAGRMGGDNITVKRLQILQVNIGHNCILVRGCVPGSNNGKLRIWDSENNPIFSVKPPPFPTFIQTSDLSDKKLPSFINSPPFSPPKLSSADKDSIVINGK
jgi:large subunit ribosomal protein L3